MEKLIPSIIGIIIATIAYGYWDANSEKRVNNADLRARVINPWGLYFDSQADYQPMDNGQLFIQVSWSQPSNDKRVSTIRVKGNVMDGTQLVASVDAPCQRAGSTWLATGKWSFNGQTSTDLVCFIKIDKILKSKLGNDPIRWDESNVDIADMNISYSADVGAVNKPMRYVTWLNEQAAKVYETMSAPFKRE
jgi:hypothetical protein